MLTSANLRRPLPDGWSLLVGVDTGTYMSAVFSVFPPDSADAFVVEEFPNYHYVGGVIDLLGDSIPEWARRVHKAYNAYKPRETTVKAWADQNSQFKTELRHYGFHLMSNLRKLELRVEITREYLNTSKRVYFAPWLQVLPHELENAKWPDETSSAGRLERVKVNDHTLDCLEHVLSRRPVNPATVPKSKHQAAVDRIKQRAGLVTIDAPRIDPHLGIHY